jgi:hypothetical protein
MCAPYLLLKSDSHLTRTLSVTRSWAQQRAPFLERYRRAVAANAGFGNQHDDFNDGDDGALPDVAMPDFFAGRYALAAREAKDSNRALLIYLHSDMHEVCGAHFLSIISRESFYLFFLSFMLS